VHNEDRTKDANTESKRVYQFMGVNCSLATSSNVKSMTEAASSVPDERPFCVQRKKSSLHIRAWRKRFLTASVIDLTLELVARLKFTPINWYNSLLLASAFSSMSPLCTTVVWYLFCSRMRFAFRKVSVCLIK